MINLLLFLLAVVLGLTLFLLSRLLRPIVVRYPWGKGHATEKGDVVILAGSYNPPHNGHLAMLSYLAARYGSVIAVVGMNPDKQYAVSPQERARMIQKMLHANELSTNVTVKVVVGYIWRFGKKRNVKIFFRGIRSWETDGKDERYLQFQNTYGPIVCGPFVWPIPTVYLEGDPRYKHISSTLIRDICSTAQKGKIPADLSGLVPDAIISDIANAYSS